MTDLALLLLLAAVGHGMCRWTGLPVIPILLGLGMLASVAGLLPPPEGLTGPGLGNAPLILVLELGLIVLVFAAGMELNPQRFRRQRRSVVWVGLVQFSVMGVVGIGVARALGFGALEAAYLGFAVSASSTLVVLGQLHATQRAFEPHGRMVIGVLLLQDALTIVVLMVLTHAGGGPVSLAAGAAWLAVMAAAAWVLQWKVSRWLVARCGNDDEALLLGVLSLLFLFLGTAHLAGLPLVIGAFLAGYGLSSFPVNGLVGGLWLSMVDFFRSLLFVTIGAMVVVPGFGSVVAAVVLAALVVVVTPPVVAAIAEWTGLNSRAAIESGLLLAQTSEFSLVLGLVGLRLGHLSIETFAVIALMAVVTMTATPLLARDTVAQQLMRLHPLRRRRAVPDPTAYHDHALILGLGSAGMWVLRPLQAAGVPVLVVDDDPQVISDLDRKGVATLRGDGSDEETLRRAGASRARLVIASMRRVADAHWVIAAVPGVPVLARVFEDSEAEEIRRLGGIPVSSAEAATEEFMKWFAKSRQPARKE